MTRGTSGLEERTRDNKSNLGESSSRKDKRQVEFRRGHDTRGLEERTRDKWNLGESNSREDERQV
jgi:hypothetical protein